MQGTLLSVCHYHGSYGRDGCLKEQFSCPKGAATVENSATVPQETKHRIPIGSSISTPGQICKIIESRVLKRYWYIHVYGSITHSSQGVKATQVSTEGSMDKHSVIY